MLHQQLGVGRKLGCQAHEGDSRNQRAMGRRRVGTSGLVKGISLARGRRGHVGQTSLRGFPYLEG